MSVSPPIRRHSNASSRQEDLINAYEAEEERILNLLSRKLEQVRESPLVLFLFRLGSGEPFTFCLYGY